VSTIKYVIPAGKPEKIKFYQKRKLMELFELTDEEVSDLDK
jgi:hypothetical protein